MVPLLQSFAHAHALEEWDRPDPSRLRITQRVPHLKRPSLRMLRGQGHRATTYK